ncbi:T9SS type A sorting domain-containing protein [Hymenobacter sp. ASUV-10]|uniref:T9SS type A sorting domain-containing protein n=1 Tax=Hymenobacter aranciens TaxID=3063996 RepID=A0ABT9BAW1_9BACT|nr:T9SS type A sorting domain-containing protein [Hymenobacter sp. ASUV-10]MDO7875414.1 T9SS type A sorting domain-containing protein [Hymenobacter sp. ASUV-10]
MKHLLARMTELRSSVIFVLPKTCRLLLGALLLLASPRAHAQTPSWQLALAANADSTSLSTMTGTATDAAGNVYVAGNFSGRIALGRFSFSSAGQNDIFVACWSPAAQAFSWARQVGGSGDDWVAGIAVADTSVYLAGSFLSPALQFGSTQLVGVTLSTAPGGPALPSMDGYLAKLSTAGAFGWAHLLADGNHNQLYRLAVSGNSVYVNGSWQGTDVVVDGVAQATSGSGNHIVAKFRDAGASARFAWAQRLPVPVYALAATGTGVFLGGDFSLSNLELGDTILHSSFAGNAHWYVTQLLDAGSGVRFGWSRTTDSPGDQTVRALAVQGGALYVAGTFMGSTARFGAFTLTNSSTRNDIFVAKFADTSPASQPTWVQQAGGIYHERVASLTVAANQVYLTGSFFSPAVTFGPHSAPNSNPTVAGLNSNNDVYVAKLLDLGSSASFAWLQAAGSATSNALDESCGVAVVGTQVYVAGGVGPGCRFGRHQLPAASGALTAFLALLDETILGTAPATGLAATLQCVPNPATGRTIVYGLPSPPALATQLLLLDALGRPVRSATVPSAQLTTGYSLDLRGLAPGLYLVRLSSGGTLLTRRLVVE